MISIEKRFEKEFNNETCNYIISKISKNTSLNFIICSNKLFTLDLINKYKNLLFKNKCINGYNYSVFNGRIISKNPNITLDYIKNNKDIPWDWQILSKYINICENELSNNLKLPWSFKYLTNNINISFQFIINNHNFDWDWYSLLSSEKIQKKDINNAVCINFFISEILNKKKTREGSDMKYYLYNSLSSNPNIDFETVNNHITYYNYWNYYKIFVNFSKNKEALLKFNLNFNNISTITNEMLKDFDWLKNMDYNIFTFFSNYRYKILDNLYNSCLLPSYMDHDDQFKNCNQLLLNTFYVNSIMKSKYINKIPDNYVNWRLLSENLSIDIDYIIAHKDKGWDYSAISKRRDIPFNFIKDNIHFNWNWNYLSESVNITHIFNNLNENWIWANVSINPDLDISILKKYDKLSWDYENKISRHPFDNSKLKYIRKNMIYYTIQILKRKKIIKDVIIYIVSFY